MPSKKPVTQQPKQEIIWMEMPAAIPNCPPGLEYLTQIDQLIIKQKVDLLEVLIGWEVANMYNVMNSLGQNVFYATESSGCLARQLCGPQRGFTMRLIDNTNKEVIRAIRDFKMCAGCCWCADGHCGFEMRVEAPMGNIIGYVRQHFSKWKLHLKLYDADRNHLFTIWGPCCACQGVCCREDLEFPVKTPNGESVVATIFKRWSGWGREMFTGADTFGTTFPMDMDVRVKALLLCTVFLMDMMLFETQESGLQAFLR